MARLPKPPEGSWTRALPRARHRAGVVRGLDLAGVLRARARRRSSSGRGSTSGGWSSSPRNGQLLHQGARRSRTRRSSSCATRTARSARSTTSAATAATSWCGPTTRGEETSGTCRQFTCKYHGVALRPRRALERSCSRKASSSTSTRVDYGLVPVHCDVWEGFIFVNFAEQPEQSLREFLGPMVTGSRAIRSTR